MYSAGLQLDSNELPTHQQLQHWTTAETGFYPQTGLKTGYTADPHFDQSKSGIPQAGAGFAQTEATYSGLSTPPLNTDVRSEAIVVENEHTSKSANGPSIEEILSVTGTVDFDKLNRGFSAVPSSCLSPNTVKTAGSKPVVNGSGCNTGPRKENINYSTLLTFYKWNLIFLFW